MRRLPHTRLIEKAIGLEHNQNNWHFHMLGKDCVFNTSKGKYLLVVEDEDSGETYYSEFDELPLKESKKIAGIMYGEGFLNDEERGNHSPQFDELMKRADEMTSKGIEWHHHHLHPNCIFNKKKGKHCIVLEDPRNGETLTAEYDEKPKEDLVRIEKAFYKDYES